MNTFQLTCFLTVAETLSFAKAARQLSITQPAVTHQIRSLEEELNAFYETVGPEDQVILLSDMFGGSVNSMMYLFLNRPNTMLITGVNLALVIGLVVGRDSLTREAVEELIGQSREAIRIVELEEAGDDSGEEELF